VTKQLPSITPVRLLWLMLPGLIALLLLLARVIYTDSFRYIFLPWNLFLAFLPIIFLVLFWRYSKEKKLSHPVNIGLFLAFLAFLPNSFYLMTDYTHLRGAVEVNVNYDIMLLNSFTFTGMLWGFYSVFQVENILSKRLSAGVVRWVIAGIYFLSSFAIYIGRFVRWNSWDIIFQPAAIIFDVSDQILNPLLHANAYIYTSLVFVILYSTHVVARRLIDK
jgi:uncharacterized membrane protein